MEMDWTILTIIFRVLALFFFGILLSEFLAVQASKRTANLLSAHGRHLLRKGVLYTGITLVILMALHELDFKLTALLGAAGILGIAIAIAAQTSVSNIISGLFLILERPFEIGDHIQIGDRSTRGSVESIDLMSIRLRSVDNAVIRIPNEAVLKTKLVNFTRKDVQHIGLEITVKTGQDLDHVQTVLKTLLQGRDDCLESPAPEVYCTHIGAERCHFSIHTYSRRDNYLALQSDLFKAIKTKCDTEGIALA